MKPQNKFEKQLEKFMRNELAKRVKRLTPGQLDLYNRCFRFNGGYVDKAHLKIAIELCDRTFAKQERFQI